MADVTAAIDLIQLNIDNQTRAVSIAEQAVSTQQGLLTAAQQTLDMQQAILDQYIAAKAALTGDAS